MTLFAVPLNAIIVTVYLLFGILGNTGALQVATGLLCVGAMAMMWLDYRQKLDAQRSAKLRSKFKSVVKKAVMVNMLASSFLSHQDYDHSLARDSYASVQMAM